MISHQCATSADLNNFACGAPHQASEQVKTTSFHLPELSSSSQRKTPKKEWDREREGREEFASHALTIIRQRTGELQPPFIIGAAGSKKGISDWQTWHRDSQSHGGVKHRAGFLMCGPGTVGERKRERQREKESVGLRGLC
ncbi:hypothetical protein JZ751_010927 [Albula glossodonta]|uniref:Uncharacterized protein n=1 Tax=Albula glossodonta TaxID=121402 RepID=A0A8T2P3U9_9TELE|nr:hypothetical protein JZ751_010927 [Albula glossodonta]